MSCTVFLARKLNLIEEIVLSKPREQVVPRCDFTHLVVIDFESTCWRNKRGQAEIIEFPAILVDMQTGAILDEFHHYLAPSENPKLTDFCIELTGISQRQVDNGIPLKTCLLLFKQWMDSAQMKHKLTSVALVSWSDWDFGVCLHQECIRKNIVKPSVFNRWIDLRAVYKEHVQQPLRGLKAAVEQMGLVFEGRAHAGIWDARNTARLAWKLHSDGARLRITKDIGPSRDSPGGANI